MNQLNFFAYRILEILSTAMWLTILAISLSFSAFSTLVYAAQFIINIYLVFLNASTKANQI